MKRKVAIPILGVIALSSVFYFVAPSQHGFSMLHDEYNRMFVGSFLNEWYVIKSNSVYFSEAVGPRWWGTMDSELLDVSPSQFEPLSWQWARVHQGDQVFLYFRDKKIENHGIQDLANLEPLTKSFGHKDYYTDGVAVYRIVSSAPRNDAKVFEDKKTLPVYIDDDTRVTLFDIEGDVVFVGDSVYVAGSLLPEAEATTFRKIPAPTDSPIPGGVWYADKDNVYLSEFVVKDADPDTFELVALTPPASASLFGIEDNYIHIARDSDSVFFAPYRRLTDTSPLGIEKSPNNCNEDVFDCFVDITIPNVKPDGLRYSDYVGYRAIERGVTITNDDGEFSLDGKKIE